MPTPPRPHRRPTVFTRRVRRAFASMPPLYHRWPGEDYDPDQSAVLEWLTHHPDAPGLLFDLARQAGAIEYDRPAHRWIGTYVRHPELAADDTAQEPSRATAPAHGATAGTDATTAAVQVPAPAQGPSVAAQQPVCSDSTPRGARTLTRRHRRQARVSPAPRRARRHIHPQAR